MLRFNTLVQMVKDNREQDLHFEAQYKIHLKKKNEEESTVSSRQQASTVAVYRDLDSLGV